MVRRWRRLYFEFKFLERSASIHKSFIVNLRLLNCKFIKFVGNKRSLTSEANINLFLKTMIHSESTRYTRATDVIVPTDREGKFLKLSSICDLRKTLKEFQNCMQLNSREARWISNPAQRSFQQTRCGILAGCLHSR